MIKLNKNNDIRTRRYNLWKKHPHCYWCDKKLKWKKSTLDHINQKTKNKKRPVHGHTVLSCKPCNNKRQADEFSSMNKIQQWIRTNGIPRLRRAFTLGKRSTPLYARLWILYYYTMKGIKRKVLNVNLHTLKLFI